MLKKIATHQLRLGMHLHKLEGRWLDHSFWKTRFVIDSDDELRRLQDGGQHECWIDTGKGVDVEPAAPPLQGTVAPAATGPDAPAPPARPVPAGASPLAEELREAVEICSRGRAAVVAMFHEARLGRTVDADGCLALVEDIALSVQRNPGALVSLARLKRMDDYSYMHSVAVCALMVALARQLGMDDEACRRAGQAGLMHDIGKALMPLDVLNKPGRLNEAEIRLMRCHPERGRALLAEGQGASAEMLDVVLHHHERVDGTGYPHRIQGSELSTLARMGAICDVYDAITSNRPYKAGWDPAESMARMASWKGQFDETIFAAFVQSLGIYPTGSLVRLASGKLAVVAEQNPHRLVAPVVNVFYSTRSQHRLPPQLLDLAREGCADRIVAREANTDGSFRQLDELWLDPALVRRVRD